MQEYRRVVSVCGLGKESVWNRIEGEEDFVNRSRVIPLKHGAWFGFLKYRVKIFSNMEENFSQRL